MNSASSAAARERCRWINCNQAAVRSFGGRAAVARCDSKTTSITNEGSCAAVVVMTPT